MSTTCFETTSLTYTVLTSNRISLKFRFTNFLDATLRFLYSLSWHARTLLPTLEQININWRQQALNQKSLPSTCLLQTGEKGSDYLNQFEVGCSDGSTTSHCPVKILIGFPSRRGSGWRTIHPGRQHLLWSYQAAYHCKFFLWTRPFQTFAG